MDRPLLSCSTGTLARYPGAGEPEGMAALMGLTQAEAFEVMVFRRWSEEGDLDRVAQAMAKVGRPIVSVHSEKRIGTALGSSDPEVRKDGERRFRLNVELAQAFGAQLLNVHLWDLPESDAQLEQNIATLQEWLPYTEAAGLQVALETTPCRLANPLDNIVRALAELDGRCRVTLDVEFLAWHGCLEQALTHPALEDKVVANVHLRDYDGSPFDQGGRRRYVNPGEGRLDLTGIVRSLLERGYQGPFTFEGSCPSQPAAEGDLSEANGYLAYLRHLLDTAVQ